MGSLMREAPVDIRYWLERAVAAVEEWAAEYGPYQLHPSLSVSDEEFAEAFAALTERLHDNYPFFHPRYAGQMLKPPHPAAVVGYVTTMLINPNNHALDGGPATAQMEKEAITDHARMFQLLRMPGFVVPVNGQGRMDLAACEDLLRTGKVGTVVLAAGTTGLGAVDSIHEALALKDRYGIRLHVDAAYGGFFALLAGKDLEPAPWRAIAHCDSVVVDPHKHGLQPYGCGAVIFADPAVGRFYAHDSPYTYFTSKDLHLGEISLECSRAGAAAAALWVTLRILPAAQDGLGRVLRATRRAALAFASLTQKSPHLALYQQPDLDIVTYFPRRDTAAEIDKDSARILAAGMAAVSDPIFLSTMRVGASSFGARGHTVRGDGCTRILRSVLMKPEQEGRAEELFARIEGLAASP